jgi:A/G-specific adenine glycosylase
VTVDTNVRRVLIHELNLPLGISTEDLEAIAYRAMPKKAARDWHYALMDYGSMKLPSRASHVKPVSRQSKFEGSLRQIRGEIVRQLTTKTRVAPATVARALDRDEEDVHRAVAGLEKDGLVRRKGSWVYLA